jgi:hypothetical protein
VRRSLVPDDVLSPEHGLLKWCEWLVAVDTGEMSGSLVVPVTTIQNPFETMIYTDVSIEIYATFSVTNCETEYIILLQPI